MMEESVISGSIKPSNSTNEDYSKTAFHSKRKIYFLLALGVLFVSIGACGFAVFPTMLRILVKRKVVLAEGTEVFDMWKVTPMPVSFSVYIFNVTNPWAVSRRGERPLVQEVGPFVFMQHRSKDILGWDNEMKTVTYRDLKQYHFVPALSRNLSEKVYSLNMPLQGIASFAKNMTGFVGSFVLPALRNLLDNYNEQLFVHRSCEELLFAGYKVDLVEDLMGLIKPFSDMPELLPNNTFGFLYGKNNSGDGVYTVYTGEDDIAKFTQIVSWNNISDLPYWNSPYCNMMNGTDGAQFPPPVTRNDLLHVYNPELCRSVYMEYETDTSVKGIPALRFGAPPRLFATPKDNPDNMCFCTDKDYCHLSGVLDLSPCRGLKIMISGPHFFKGHPFIKSKVDGLVPSEELHDTFVDIEPNTGIVIRASRKLQINFLVEKFSSFKQTANVEFAAMPLLWIAEEVELNDDLVTLVNSKVHTPITIAKSVLTGCVVLGIMWMTMAGIVAVYVFVMNKRTSNSEQNHYKAVPSKHEELITNNSYAPMIT